MATFEARFSAFTVEQVWQKGTIVGGYEQTKYRKDQCGAWITRSEFGNRNSIYGWEVDHITPLSQNGSDQLSNLRPLHWQNNVRREELNGQCAVTAQGERNVVIR